MMSANEAVSADQALASSCRIQKKATAIVTALAIPKSAWSWAMSPSEKDSTVCASHVHALTATSASNEGIVAKGVYAYGWRASRRMKVHAVGIVSPRTIVGRISLA